MPTPLIKPFKGLLYNRDRIGDISRCVCPPYDIIPDVTAYYDRGPYNAIRLELPMTGPGVSRYDAARETMEKWLSEQVLVYDDEETIYVYDQEFEVDGTRYVRRGLIPMVRLDRERILTHEKTRQAAREDREKLIGTVKTLTSLVFALYEDEECAVEHFLATARMEKIFDFTDELSMVNRFYRLQDRDEMEKLASLLDRKNIYVADGHHRLSVLFKLGLPYAAIYLTNLCSDGIVILPYHRVIKLKKARPVPALLNQLEGHARIDEVPCTGYESLRALLRRINASTDPSYVLYGKDDQSRLYVITADRPVYRDDTIPDVLKSLRVNILHEGLLKDVLGIEDEEMSFPNSAEDAYEAVRTGTYDLAFLVPPTTVEEVKRVAENGLFMPPKSTFFYPKILTGLVFHKYA